EEAQVDFAAAVDAVEGHAHVLVGAQQPVAADHLAGAGQVGQLELAARHDVAQVAQRAEAALDDVIETLRDQLVPVDELGQMLREAGASRWGSTRRQARTSASSRPSAGRSRSTSSDSSAWAALRAPRSRPGRARPAACMRRTAARTTLPTARALSARATR